MTSYGERILQNIIKQCESRGIPAEESDSVLAHIRQATGTRVLEMSDKQLRRVQSQLDKYLVDYLEGQKRRPMLNPVFTWPDDIDREIIKSKVIIAGIKGNKDKRSP